MQSHSKAWGIIYHKYYHNHFTVLWTLCGTTQVRRYQKKHSPTHTYRGHQSSLIHFLHLLQSMAMASSLFNLCAWQSFFTISLRVFSGLAPSTSHSMHFFTQLLSSFRSTLTVPVIWMHIICNSYLFNITLCFSQALYNTVTKGSRIILLFFICTKQHNHRMILLLK